MEAQRGPGRPKKMDQVDDTKETVSQFLDKIAVAKSSGEEWVETSPEIIMHYNRHGLNGAKFFIFEGIKVCELGKLDEIIKEIEEPLHYKMYGASEAKIDNIG